MMSDQHGHRPVDAGAVILLEGTSEERLLPAIVAALTADDCVTVVPLHPAVEYATEWDLLLDANVLGYRAMAQVWNYGTVLREQCSEVIAHLAVEQRSDVERLLLAATTGSTAPPELEVGPPARSAGDPRLLFQDSEAEAAHDFWQPALALAGAATLGELVRHRRDEVKLDPAELPGVGATWLDPVERDAIDLRSSVPATALAALLRRLGLMASARLRGIVRTTIEATAPEFARGSRATEETRLSTDAYLDAVFTELEEPR